MGGSRPEHVAKGQWVGEPVLWTHWSFQGAMRAAEDTKLQCLEAEEFMNSAVQFRNFQFQPGQYAAAYVAELNSLDEDALTDIYNDSVDVPAILSEVFGEVYEKECKR